MFIFDRSFLPVAAGLLTALLFVGVVHWMDGGLLILKGAESVADREVQLAFSGERRLANVEPSLIAGARPDPLHHEAPMLVPLEDVACGPGVTSPAGARPPNVEVIPPCAQ